MQIWISGAIMAVLYREELQYEEIHYKYKLTSDCRHEFIKPVFGKAIFTIVSDYYTLTNTHIQFFEGFGWDGASGPTFDTSNSMRAALVHDALYRAMAEGHLSDRRYRRGADREFRAILKQDGMFYIRRWGWWAAVRLFGGINAKQKDTD